MYVCMYVGVFMYVGVCTCKPYTHTLLSSVIILISWL